MRISNRLIIFIFLLPACKSKLQDDGKTFHETYIVSDIPGIDSFKKMNKRELEFYKSEEELFKSAKNNSNNNPLINHYENNRSRIFMDSDPNNKIYPGEKELDLGLSLPCDCLVGQDTLFVSMNLGFFGGMGFQIKVSDNRFNSGFFFYTRNAIVYKSDLSDTAFADEAKTWSKYQYLVIEQEPTFKAGQQLTGYLTMTSNRFYELKTNDHLDSTYVTARIFFTCNTRSKQMH